MLSSEWVQMKTQYASLAAATSFLFMLPSDSSTLLVYNETTEQISNGLAGRTSVPSKNFNPMQATDYPDAYFLGFGCKKNSWFDFGINFSFSNSFRVAGSSNQGDVLEFEVDSPAIFTYLQVLWKSY